MVSKQSLQIHTFKLYNHIAFVTLPHSKFYIQVYIVKVRLASFCSQMFLDLHICTSNIFQEDCSTARHPHSKFYTQAAQLECCSFKVLPSSFYRQSPLASSTFKPLPFNPVCLSVSMSVCHGAKLLLQIPTFKLSNHIDFLMLPHSKFYIQVCIVKVRLASFCSQMFLDLHSSASSIVHKACPTTGPPHSKFYIQAARLQCSFKFLPSSAYLQVCMFSFTVTLAPSNFDVQSIYCESPACKLRPFLFCFRFSNVVLKSLCKGLASNFDLRGSTLMLPSSRFHPQSSTFKFLCFYGCSPLHSLRAQCTTSGFMLPMSRIHI